MYADFGHVACFAALLRAYERARRAKRGRGGEPLFHRDLERELLRLESSLLAQSWHPAPYRFFWLRKTKARLVSEATFAGRVVHHALVAELERVWEPAFIADSYACRRGKGTHVALRQAQLLCRRFPFAMRLDVEKYFDSIDHSVLCALLAQRNDSGCQWLCERIVRAAAVPTVAGDLGRAIPIGNLTSQFFANVYLHPLDEMVNAEWPGYPYLRYMDDVLVFGADKAVLWVIAEACGDLLARHGLRLRRSVTAVFPITEGVPWLGMRVFPATIRLQREGRTRFVGKLRAALSSDRGEEAARSRLSSLCGHVQHASTLRLRRSLLSSMACRDFSLT